MERSPGADATFQHDVFISYSRRNTSFASALEKALRGYRPPKDLKAPQRFLTIFRDTQDFTGNEYYKGLDRHLAGSAKLIVICSPDARRSPYVDGEIRRFVALRGAENLVPLLVSGIPNNEAGPDGESELAFPPALCEVMTIPLAADFRGIDQDRPNVKDKRYRDAWFKVLADLYGLPRADVEQREKKRQARTRRVRTVLAATVAAIVAIAGSIALWFRQDAEASARIARYRIYVDNVQRAMQEYQNTNLPGMAALLAAAQPAKDRPEDFRAFEWYYLWRLAHSGEATEIVRDPTAVALALCPNGLLLATANKRTVKLWSLQTRQQVAALDLQEGNITSLACSPDSTLLATAGMGMGVRTWDVTTGKLAAEIPQLGTEVEQVAFSPSGSQIAGLSYDGPEKLARIWALASGRIVAELRGAATASGSGLFMAFSPDGSRLALSSSFGIDVHLPPSGEVVWSFQELDGFGRASAAAFSKDSRTLIAATEDGQLLFYDLARANGKPARAKASGEVYDLAVSPDGSTLAVVSDGNKVELWDLESRNLRNTLRFNDVSAIGFTPDSSLATAGEGAVRLWNVGAHSEYDEVGLGDIDLGVIAPSATNEQMALVNGNALVIWDTAKRREIARLDSGDEVRDIAYAPNRRLVAIASGANGLFLWEAPAKTKSRLSRSPNGVYAVAFSPDETLLAAAGAGGAITIWDVGRREPLSTSFAGHTMDVTCVAFAPDGKRIITSGDDRTIRLWDVNSGALVARAPLGAADAPTPDSGIDREPLAPNVRFSPDGGIAAVAIEQKAVLWRVSPSGALEQLAEFATHTDRVNDLAFSPDGRRIATASADTTVKLWDTLLLQEIVTLREPKSGRARPEFIRNRENEVSSVAFTRDGRTLVTGLLDGSLRFRHAATDADVNAASTTVRHGQ